MLQAVQENDRVMAMEGRHAFKEGRVVSLTSYRPNKVQVLFDGENEPHHVIACHLSKEE